MIVGELEHHRVLGPMRVLGVESVNRTWASDGFVYESEQIARDTGQSSADYTVWNDSVDEEEEDMDSELEGMLDRADELLADLETEYTRSLRAQDVSARAQNLTHEVLEKVRHALDHAMRRSWERHVAPELSERDRRRARFYFPIADSEESFRSQLGRGHMENLSEVHRELHDFLWSQQPFSSPDNRWLQVLGGIAGEGKHVTLSPQRRTETRRVKVSRGGSSVSWNPDQVRFSGGIRVAGAPVDPSTQRIVPTEGVTETIETWVAFLIEGYDINALGFCKDVCGRARVLIEKLAGIGQP